MEFKGLSQILYLVVAASVLMIAALSIVFMLDEGLGDLIDFGGTADASQCDSLVEQTCGQFADEVDPPTAVDAPNACFVEIGGEETAVPESEYAQFLDSEQQTVNCEEVVPLLE